MNIIELAKQAGLDLGGENTQQPLYVLTKKELERFAQIIRNQALEDAAVECDKRNHAGDAGALMAGRAIRAMKEQI